MFISCAVPGITFTPFSVVSIQFALLRLLYFFVSQPEGMLSMMCVVFTLNKPLFVSYYIPNDVSTPRVSADSSKRDTNYYYVVTDCETE